MNHKKKTVYIYLLSAWVILAGVWLDQFTKTLAVKNLKGQNAYTLIKNVFSLEYLENTGAAFGLLENHRSAQIVFALSAFVFFLIAVYCFIKLPKTKRYVPLFIIGSCIIAGAAGNMLDRIRLGYVVDFFYLEWINFPVFNVADIFVTVSFIFLIFYLLFYYREEELDCLKFSRNRTAENEE